MLRVHAALQPLLISEYSDTFKLIIVEILDGNKNIRVTTGYGPKEGWDMDVKMQFYTA